MNYENILKIIQSKPYYVVDLAITDYQDEGIKLEVYIWKDLCHLHDIIEFLSGEYKELYKHMIILNHFLKENSVNVYCYEELQRC